jgi:hypothetical protein
VLHSRARPRWFGTSETARQSQDFYGRLPDDTLWVTTANGHLAKTHANDFRRVVTDPIYQAVFPKMRLARETDSEIHTTLRGRRYATSIQGTLTGRGGNLFIIDDPLKPGDAISEVSRERVIEWYRSTLVTRPDDKQAARIMVVMQRIHVEDLVGYLLENEAGFEVLSLPSVAQSTTTHDLGGGRTHVREKGDLLHPTHEPAEVLLEIKKSMGSMLFSAQYQQSPEPAGGKIIKRKMLQYYSEIERLPTDRIVLSWDIALSVAEIPCRQRDRCDDRLQMTRRHSNDEPFHLARGDLRSLVGHRVDVPVRLERGSRTKQSEHILDKRPEIGGQKCPKNLFRRGVFGGGRTSGSVHEPPSWFFFCWARLRLGICGSKHLPNRTP